MKRLILIYLTSLVCSFFFYTNAQITSSKHNLQIINVNTENYPEAIFVEFTVTDSEGEFVPNLTVDDFIVKDNGTKKYGCKRLVQDLSELRLPVDIVFLVDNSQSMSSAQNKINNAIPQLLKGLKDKGDIRVALARFGESGYTNDIINCEEHKWATIEKNNLGFTLSPLQNDKDITYFKDSIWSKNKYDGYYEPFYNVLHWASQQDLGYRADALKIFILLGNASIELDSGIWNNKPCPLTQKHVADKLSLYGIQTFIIQNKNFDSQYKTIVTQTKGAFYYINDASYDGILTNITDKIKGRYG